MSLKKHIKIKPENWDIRLNISEPGDSCHEAADEFWRVWNEVGEPHKHGYYESTWMAINAALAKVGVIIE